jgi:hypothetical protein
MTGRDLLIYGAVIAAWYLLNRFLLPKMGVDT